MVPGFSTWVVASDGAYTSLDGSCGPKFGINPGPGGGGEGGGGAEAAITFPIITDLSTRNCLICLASTIALSPIARPNTTRRRSQRLFTRRIRAGRALRVIRHAVSHRGSPFVKGNHDVSSANVAGASRAIEMPTYEIAILVPTNKRIIRMCSEYLHNATQPITCLINLPFLQTDF